MGKGQFVNQPFCLWCKKPEKCKVHATNQYHQEALHLTNSFLQSVETPATSTVSLIDRRKSENIARNRHVLKCIVAGSALYLEETQKD